LNSQHTRLTRSCTSNNNHPSLQYAFFVGSLKCIVAWKFSIYAKNKNLRIKSRIYRYFKVLNHTINTFSRSSTTTLIAPIALTLFNVKHHSKTNQSPNHHHQKKKRWMNPLPWKHSSLAPSHPPIALLSSHGIAIAQIISF
jgi:hypothetical protein